MRFKKNSRGAWASNSIIPKISDILVQSSFLEWTEYFMYIKLPKYKMYIKLGNYTFF